MFSRYPVLLSGFAAATLAFAAPADTMLHFEGRDGPGKGRTIVLISGDEEYRSEEALPMLGKVLSQRHGFDCTVLFAIDPATGLIDSNHQGNIPGLEALADADLMIIATRFRRLPPEQLRPIATYLQSGKPVIGLRTATHAFTGDAETNGIVWRDFGLNVLGEKWVAHHGRHLVEGARGVIEPGQADHPVLRGVGTVYGPSDVYTVSNLNPEATILLRGEVTATLAPDSPAVEGAKNAPMMPLAWLRDYQVPEGKPGRAFTSTMGAAVDFLDEDLRRLVVNAAYHLTGLEVPERADVRVVDPYRPTFFGFVRGEDAYRKRNLRPSDLGLGKDPAPFEAVPLPATWPENVAISP
jgi:type 1 glutamine amidotransferase